MKNALHFKAKAQNAKQGGIVKMKKLFTKWLSALLIAALLLPCVAVAEGELSGGGELTFDNEPPVLDAANAQAVDASTIQTDLNVENDNDEVLSNAVDPVVLETEDVELNGDELTVEAMETTYWFMVKDELYQEQTAGDGETFVKPADPSAPEGSVFVGWYLEDGTQLFVDGAEEISNADEARRFINVLARFETNFDDEDEKMGTPRDDDAAADVEGSDVFEDDTTTDVEGSDVFEDDDTTTDVEGSGECGDGDAATDVSVGDAPIDAESDPVEATDCGNDAPEIETQGIVDAGSVEGKEAAEGMNNEDRPDVGSEENANGEANPDEEGNAAPNEDGDVSPDDAADTAESPVDGDNTDEVLPVRVAFETVPTEAAVRVFGLSVSDGEDNSVEMPSEEDGSYALLPGDYTYSAMAEGYVPVEAVPFTVDASGEPLEINIELEPEEAAVEPVCVIFNAVPETAAITVYAVQHEALHEKDDAAESISPQEDGSFLLLPGEYAYSATAEGYIPAEAVPFTVDEEALTISVALDPLVEEPVAFDQSSELYGVVVRVQADPGVFPAGAELCVNRVPVMKRREADAAIEEVRDEGVNVAVSYTFDIKVIDSETGEELQPAEGQNVNVSFALAEVADENLEIQVYHVTEEAGELSAEALDIVSPETREEATATVETSGFSIYTVEFHYNRLEYVLQGDSSVALSEILNAVGLGGEVSAVEISNTELFSASNEGGEWVVYAHQAFESTEWMKVTINGVVYEITVTDDQEETQEVSVTFHANGGTFYDDEGDEIGATRVDYWKAGCDIHMDDWMEPAPGAEGKVFLGYARTEYAGEDDIVLTWGEERKYTIPAESGDSITLYAVWGDGLKVIFDANGGSFYDDEGDKEGTTRDGYWRAGWVIDMDDWMRPEPGAEGKVFLGYALNSNATDDAVVLDWGPGYEIPEGYNENSLTLYAVWSSGVKVTFDANGGTFYNDEGDKDGTTRDGYWKAGWDIHMDDWMEPAPGAKGKVFLGYARTKDAGENDIVLTWGEERKYPIPAETGDSITLYAVWGDGLPVIFDANGGTFYNEEGDEVGATRVGYWKAGWDIELEDWMEPAPGNNKAMQGKVFLGYARTKDAGEDGIELTWGEKGKYPIPDEPVDSITLYAVWSNGVQVTFDANGGTFYNEEGDEVGATRVGYWKAGWDIELENWMEPAPGNNKALQGKVFLGYALEGQDDIVLTWGEEGKYPIPDVHGDSITLYAVWGDGLQVIFDAGDGSFYDDEGDKEGTTRDGYWMPGWKIEMDDWMRPEPGAEGQVFLGYALDRDATDDDVVLDWGTRYKIPEGYNKDSLTLYAVWSSGVKVTFDANGGTFYNDEGDKDGTTREGCWMPSWKIEMEDWMEPAPGEKGKVFLGYALNDAANAPIVLDWGTRYKIPDSDPPSSITLKAVWGDGLKVIFDAGDGSFYDDEGDKEGTTRFGYWMPGWKIEMDDWMRPEPGAEGKVFLGYASGDDGNNIVLDWGTKYSIPESDGQNPITLKAVWSSGVQVTFDANGGTFYNDEGDKDGTTREGNWMPGWKIEMEDWMEPAPGAEGKVFLGYALEEQDGIVLDWGTRYRIPDSDPPSSIRLKAVWDTGKKVIFDANGGTFYDNEGDYDGTTRFGYWMPGWKIEMDDWMRPEPGAEGQVFLGYASGDEENNIVLDWGTKYSIPESDGQNPITLKAVWSNGVPVTFDANGGTFYDDEGDEDGTTREGNWMPDWKIEMEDWMEPAPGVEGQVFLGYALKDDANNSIVLDWGTRYKIPDSDPPSSITLKAVWGDGLQVIFDANGGSFRENMEDEGEDTRYGYWNPGWEIQMNGWMEPRSGENEPTNGKLFLGYALGREATDEDVILDWGTRYRIPDDAREPLTLYAVWSSGVKVTFDANDGKFYNDEGDEDGTPREGNWMPGWKIEMEDWMEPAHGEDSKVFLGYALKDDANNSIVLDWGTRYRIPDSDPPSSITLKAVWATGVKVTFNANGGCFGEDDGEDPETTRFDYWMPDSKIKMDDWMVPEPSEDASTKDKVFLGYAQNPEGGDVIFSWEDRFTVPDDSTTLYAVWANGVKVTFDANGGIFRNDEGGEDETPREGNWMPGWKIEMEDWMEPAPGKEGKVFLGYALNDAANAPIVLDWGTRYKIPDSNPPSSITLYAVWATGVKVTFNANGGCFGEDDGEDPETTRFDYWMPSWKIEMDDWMRPEPGAEGKVFLGFALRNAADAPIVLDERTRYRIPDKDNEEITLFALWDDPNHSWGAPTYTWSADNSQVTAKHVCVNYTAHVEEETASTTAKITTPATCTAKGKTTYTAVFTNTAFASQTKVVENIDALGHNWGAWTKVSDATTSSPEQQRRICARCNAVETRSVGDKLPTAPAVVESPQVISPTITIPKVPASVKAKAAKNGKVTVSWKAIKKSKKTKALLTQIKRIELQYSTDPTFATDVYTKNIGKKKTKVTLKLHKKTVYYIRVRYTDGVGGVSNWSAVKKVKTKK